MITYQEAIEILGSVATTLSSETLPIGNTISRILSKDILSPEMLPPFNNSAMDGFTFRQEDLDSLSSTPRLKVLGTIAAGDQIKQSVLTGYLEAWEIMTGAPVPEDCNTVIRIEDTKRDGHYVEFLKPCKKNQNLRLSGEDFKTGDWVAKSGTRLYPEHVMAFAALGIDSVPVFRKPSVKVLSTGAELSSHTDSNIGNIRNSTGPYLTSELTCLNTNASFLGAIKDEPKHFMDLIRAQVEEGVDVIISTGAVSMGKYDFVASALHDLGAKIHFHKVAIRPGKPLLFATLGKTAFFGVPGNPVSSVVTLRFFIEPYLRRLQNLPPEKSIKTILENEIQKPDGLRCFFKAKTNFAMNPMTCEVSKGQESFKTASLLDANSWAILPEAGSVFSKGTEIEVFPMHSWSQKEVLI